MERLLTIVGIISASLLLWLLVIAAGALIISGVAGIVKPKYDTTPIQCERELPNSEH